MEFDSDGDIQIAEKMLQYPLLGESTENRWNLQAKRGISYD